MSWECIECGSQTKRFRRPTVCPICGTGGSQFVPAGIIADHDVLDESYGEDWLEHGMSRPDRTLMNEPGLEPGDVV